MAARSRQWVIGGQRRAPEIEMLAPAPPIGKRTARARVALVHDYLNQYGGAERVLEALHELFPQAPVYTSIYDTAAMPPRMRQWDIHTSWMQRLPGWHKYFRHYVPLYPSAFESFDFTGYNLILSSSSAFAKGIIPPTGGRHVCYCHTPMRFAWRTDSYIEREQIARPQRAILSILLTYVRLWDAVTAHRVDTFIANSREVAERIRRYYGRTSVVIPPPVDLPPYRNAPPGDYLLAGGRLIPYKRLDLAIQAARRLNMPLKIFGEGRDRATLEALAGPQIEFLGKVSEPELRDLFGGCRAFIFPGEEDFGITPLEAMAAGRPVVAFAAGGALDSVVEGVTGRFFDAPHAEALAGAIEAVLADQYDPLAIRAHAEGFGRDVFLRRVQDVIEDELGA